MYKTGDLACRRPDGSIEFLGRIDQQIKIRGFRIELGEIEAVLGQHPAVREAVVLARESGAGKNRLVAYVVPKIEDRRLKIEDSNLGSSERLSSIFYPLSSELRAFLKQQLPDYMMPAAVVLVNAFPLTSSGKIDRRVLAELYQDLSPQEDRYVAPRTAIEDLLAGIWAEVLGMGSGPGQQPIGIYDNFFELGGHSLLATQVIFRVSEVLHVEPPLRSLFEAGTIAEFAAVIQRAQDSNTAQPPEIVPLDRGRHRVQAR